MKKYLFTSAAALAFCGLFTSCTHDLGYDESSAQNSVVKKYEQAFITAFGQPDPNQEWGFGISTQASTRAYTVPGTSNTFDEFYYPSDEELAVVFPKDIPEGAEEVDDLGSLYFGKQYTNQYGTGTATDLYAVYVNFIGEGHNLKVTKTGEVTIGGSYDNGTKYYNVYVKVNGNLTIKRQGTPHFNLYILSGNVTLESNFGEMSGTISVAAGATLNDQRKSIAANNGVKLFNRGTINATNAQGYDIGNNSTIYNQSHFYITGPMSYSAGAGNTSYFYNIGDGVELTALSMTLNSTCNFISDGTVNITNETFVTQSGIVWVNNGHYTTGSLVFSAQNGTFYNYCQLKVTGNTTFTDGEFNLMSNSYTEMGTGLFNNFTVNMYNNSGINIKNGTKWGRQGGTIYQGFRAVNDNATAYVRLGGNSSVPCHNGSAIHFNGAKLTYAIENIKFYKSFNAIGVYSNYNNVNYWDETTAEALADEKNAMITFDPNDTATRADFSELTVTEPAEGQCSATWHGKDPDPSYEGILRVVCEDLSVTQASDWDFNDVVFDVQLVDDNKQVKITLKAAGGTLPLCVGDDDSDNRTHEVHELFAKANPGKNITTSTMINTGHTGAKYTITGCKEASFYLTIKDEWKEGHSSGVALLKSVAKNIPIDVYKMVDGTKRWVPIEWKKGNPTAKMAFGQNYNWCDERISIQNTFKAEIDNSGQYVSTFDYFVKGILGDNWYKVEKVTQAQVEEFKNK